MSASVLVLNIDYTPLEVISWREAIQKVILGKVEVVEAYADQAIRSARKQWPFPAVVRLKEVYVKHRCRLSRKNILARDNYTCQYCGTRPKKFTIDHVFPKSRSVNGWVTLPWSGEPARATSWDNLTTACGPCNNEKADRTPAEAGLTLLSIPEPPGIADMIRMAFTKCEIPDEWKLYLPEDAAHWADFWEVTLDDD